VKIVPNDTGQNLHKYYDQLHVLKELIYTFKRRNCLHRGCLRSRKNYAIANFRNFRQTTVESGIELRINNEDILTMNDKTLSKFRNLNLGFQFHQLLPEFTALENVCIRFYCKQIEGRNRSRSKLLTYLGLSHRMNHKPNELWWTSSA
jgi:lipoprotein-releasing system ATP-binding protein